MKFIAVGEDAQRSIGEKIGAAVASGSGLVIHLKGNLGAGKTTLTRGMLSAMGHRGAVRSPTYTLMEPYQSLEPPVFHFDLYRLSDPEELEYLGLRDLLEQHAVLIFEWPENAADGLPGADILIDIRHMDDGREIVLSPLTTVGECVAEQIAESEMPG